MFEKWVDIEMFANSNNRRDADMNTSRVAVYEVPVSLYIFYYTSVASAIITFFPGFHYALIQLNIQQIFFLLLEVFVWKDLWMTIYSGFV